jgi:serine/threonine protein kinase
MPPTTIGPYRIVRQLGEGGMGVVYEAVNDAIERRVAIKVLHAEYAKDKETASRFFDEARAVNRIEHPSLVQVSDYGRTTDNTAYLVMEFLRGESLAQRLDKTHAAGKRIELSEVIRIAWQTADALRAAHEKSIVHRDMKPDNLMLVRDPIAPGGERVKILDFGIAKLMKSGTKRTATSAVMGTPLYMSPEQCRGAGEVDERSDVYSLGVVLYEMMAGRCPFDAAGGGEVLGMHLFKEPPPLGSFAPAAPPELVALTHRLLLKDKDARPAMNAVVRELARIGAKFSSSLGIVAPPDGDATTLLPSHAFDVTARPGRSSTLGRSAGERLRSTGSVRLWGGIGGASILLVGSLIWLMTRTPAPPAQKGENQATSPSIMAGKPIRETADSPTDGGVHETKTPLGVPVSTPANPPGTQPARPGTNDKALPTSQPVRPKTQPQPPRKKSAFADVD